MRYFYDTEFLEGTQKRRLMGYELPSFFDAKSTIDLISIGIVAEDGRELYCISKDFNLEEAWNRYDLKPDINKGGMKRVYWIRENVLLPIYKECVSGDARNHIDFTYSGMKAVIHRYGKTKSQIAFEIVNFVHGYSDLGNWLGTIGEYYDTIIKTEPKDKPQFYGYYSAYDHVALCWLFGKMIDLPTGFPMYTIDLKQVMDNKAKTLSGRIDNINNRIVGYNNFKEQLAYIKCRPNYPKQTNEHSAIHDARWNKELYEFLQSL